MNAILAIQYIDWLEEEAEKLNRKAKLLSEEPPSSENNILMGEYTGRMQGYAECIEKFLELAEQNIASQN